MRKIFVLILTLASLIFALPALADGDGITVLYNGLAMSFADAEPTVISDRVMLPFRAVFEQMNAEVTYDNETRTVYADTGERELYFSLDSAEIYLKGAREPVCVMDVPPVVENGRTLIPVRAVSEAAGLTVGWDSGERTVVIIDDAAVARSIANACPDLNMLAKLYENPAKIYTHTETTRVYAPDYAITAKAETTADGEAQRSVAAAEITVGGQTASGSIEVIVTRNELMFKTDLAEKLGDALPEAWAKYVKADKWYSADWGELEEYISGSDSGFLAAAVGGALDETDGRNLVNGLISSVTEGLDPNSAADARLIPVGLEAVSRIFGADKLKITRNSDGSAEMRLNFSREDSESLIDGGAYLSYSATYSGGVAIASEAIIEFGEFRFENSARGSAEGIIEKIELPASTVNFVDVLYTAAGF